MIERLVNNELERLWKETVVTHVGICLKTLKKAMNKPQSRQPISGLELEPGPHE
jgi:hypothetical protein